MGKTYLLNLDDAVEHYIAQFLDSARSKMDYMEFLSDLNALKYQELDWEAAETHLRFYMAEYASFPEGALALNLTLVPLFKRYQDGERTKSLYDEMMDCE